MLNNTNDIRINILYKSEENIRRKSRIDSSEGRISDPAVRNNENRFNSNRSGNNVVNHSGNNVDDSSRWRKNDISRKKKDFRVDFGYNKRLYTGNVSSYYNSHYNSNNDTIIQRLRLVRASFLKKAMISIPAITIPTIFLNNTLIKAEKIFKEPDIKLGLFPFLRDANDLIDEIKVIFGFFANLPDNISRLSLWLLLELYNILILVLQTPLFIFNNSYTTDVSKVFAISSIIIVTILTMVEGMKRMFKKKAQKLDDIAKRYFVALAGAGIAPFLFENTAKILNMAVKAISKIGVLTPQYIQESYTPIKLDWLQVIAMISFDIMLIALLIPVLLQNGRRFFDLMVASSLTPLALTAWIFDDYRILFKNWWNNFKINLTTPLIYAIYISLLGLFIFGTPTPAEGGQILIKLLIIIGGVMKLADPPSFVTNRTDQGKDVIGVYGDTRDGLRKAWNIITFKSIKDRVVRFGNKRKK